MPKRRLLPKSVFVEYGYVIGYLGKAYMSTSHLVVNVLNCIAYDQEFFCTNSGE